MERRLAAKFPPDIVGCSRLIREDEPGSICIARNVYNHGKDSSARPSTTWVGRKTRPPPTG
jgi:hypothetical protein